MERRKNQSVELCRIIGALIILGHHSYLLGRRELFVGGWIFVEFFFMITGFYTAKHFEKTAHGDLSISASTAMGYVYQKVRRLVPFAWAGILLGLLANLIKNGLSLRDLLALPYNMLFLAGSTLPVDLPNYDSPLWFVTMIILFLPPVVILMTKLPRAYRHLLCWLIPALFIIYNVIVIGRVAVWESCPSRLMRGAADLMLGTGIFYLTRIFCHARPGTIALNATKALGIVLFGVLSWLAICSPTGMLDHSVGFLCLAFLATLLLLANDQNYLNNDALYRVSMHLGALSMPLFCLHHPVERLVQLAVPSLSYNTKLLLATAASLVLSEGLMVLWSHRQRH